MVVQVGLLPGMEPGRGRGALHRTCPPPSHRGPRLCHIFEKGTGSSGRSHTALTHLRGDGGHFAFPHLIVPQSFRDRVANGKHAKDINFIYVLDY